LTARREHDSPPKRSDGTCAVFAFDEQRVRRALEAMPSDERLQDIADTFQVLGHPTRVRIILALSREELCVCDLAQVLGLSVSATSHQLRSMRRMRLVQYRTEGKFAYYSLCDPFVAALLDDCVQHLSGEEPDRREGRKRA